MVARIQIGEVEEGPEWEFIHFPFRQASACFFQAHFTLQSKNYIKRECLGRLGDKSMINQERKCEIDVSEFYFRLTTESIRLFSNKNKVLSGFQKLIDDRAGIAKELLRYYTASDLREHLAVIPTDGEIPLKFSILETSAASIDDAAVMLQQMLDRSIDFADALSLMMYDLVVDEAKTEVLTKLGLSPDQAERYRRILKKTPSNVVPFR